MERESFEDLEVANLLNRHYVAIKVDREERPDVDHIYMTVCQALTGQGGWPMTIVMTPEKQPFFAGTYFPKTRKYGRAGLLEILEQIRQKWAEDRDRLATHGEEIAKSVAAHYQSDRQNPLSAAWLDEAFQSFSQSFDDVYGGFGSAPKFPTPHNLLLLLRYRQLTGNEEALTMVRKTLGAMHSGGIWDHIGSGFSRYSVDERWLIPHFEKMLYDNALLAMAYLAGYQTTGETEFATVARAIFDYVTHTMTSSDGGFYSAEDADSDGAEGKFYVWTPDEIEMILGSTVGEQVIDFFGMTDVGNFEGHNVLNTIGQDLARFCQARGLDVATFERVLADAKQALFRAREARVHPYKDDKILTAWNGLMIAALAQGARVLADPGLSEIATRAANLVWTKLRRQDGRLLARLRDGAADHLAYLDDHAFYLWGLLELYQATLDVDLLTRAVDVAQQMVDLFWDAQQGGLYFTGADAESLIARPKEFYDGAMPSGNSVAALGLLTLARITGDLQWHERAEHILRAGAGDVMRYPAGHTLFLLAASVVLFPAYEIVIAGNPADDDCQRLLAAVHRRFLPNVALILRDTSRDTPAILEHLSDYRAIDGRATAYICERFACQEPTNALAVFEHRLDQLSCANPDSV